MNDPLGKFATQALPCTDQEADPVQILVWFARRWQMEVTFHEVRAHLGVETREPVVGVGYCPYYAGSLGPLLAGDAAGS
jgi:hypothetical protein